MNRTNSLLIAGLALASSTNLQAQDLFGSANSVTRSYNYVEAQYLPGMDVDLPVAATIVVSVTDQWSIWGQYIQADNDSAGGELGLGEATAADISVSAMSLGLLYHSSFQMFADTDWVAGFAVGRVETEGNVPVFSLRYESTTTVQEAYLGLRRTLAPKLEGEIGLDVLRSDGDFDTTGIVKVVYRVLPAIDIALGLNDIGEEDTFGIGLRYTW